MLPVSEEALFSSFRSFASSFNDELWSKLLLFRNEIGSKWIESSKIEISETDDSFLLFLQSNLLQYFGDICYLHSSSTTSNTSATSKTEPSESVLPWKKNFEIRRKIEIILISLVFHLLFFQLNEKIDAVSFLYSFVGIYRGSYVDEALKLLNFPLEEKKKEFSIVSRLFVPFSKTPQSEKKERTEQEIMNHERVSMAMLKRCYRSLDQNLTEEVTRIGSCFLSSSVPASHDDANIEVDLQHNNTPSYAVEEVTRKILLKDLHAIYLNRYADEVVPSLLLNGGIQEIINSTASSLPYSRKISLECLLSAYVVKTCSQKDFLSMSLLGKNVYALSFDIRNAKNDNEEMVKFCSSVLSDAGVEVGKYFIDRLLNYLTPSALPLDPMKRYEEFIASSVIVSKPRELESGEAERSVQQLSEYMRNGFEDLSSGEGRKKGNRLKIPFIPRFKDNNLLLMIIRECDVYQFGRFLVNLFPELKYYLTLGEISPELPSSPEQRQAGKCYMSLFSMISFPLSVLYL
jgi:hypothetical protein